MEDMRFYIGNAYSKGYPISIIHGLDFRYVD